MITLFTALYRLFARHRGLFYSVLLVLVGTLAYFASRVRFVETIQSFLPRTGDTELVSSVFDKLGVKDRIVVLVAPADTTAAVDRKRMIEAADSLGIRLREQGGEWIAEVLTSIGSQDLALSTDWVYRHLPLLLSDEGWARLDSLTTPQGLRAQIGRTYTALLSPAGFALHDHLLRDPLGLGTSTLASLQGLDPDTGYELHDEHLFSPDGSTLLISIKPRYALGETGPNEAMIACIEAELERIGTHYPDLRLSYLGGASVGVYNARQIKADTLLTSLVALGIIVVFILAVFGQRRAVGLIVAPAAFGALFALGAIYFIQGSISAIAVGAGSAIMGIALSYAIHLLAHQSHVKDVEQLLRELVYPLTIGSFTTIGAFLGLLFTTSPLLRDFGLFSSLALIGTTLFCLVFLPQFLSGRSTLATGRTQRTIERITAYPYERNRWLVGAIGLCVVVGLVASRHVGFDSDMMNINYMPTHLKEAEAQLDALTARQAPAPTLIVSTGRTLGEATEQYKRTDSLLARLQHQGLVESYSDALPFVVDEAEQARRLERWRSFWSKERRRMVERILSHESEALGFRPGTFDGFYDWLDSTPATIHYDSIASQMRALGEWITVHPRQVMLLSYAKISTEHRQSVYTAIEAEPRAVVFDRAYFTSRWVDAVQQDFYFTLMMSSLLVFIALCISYGRIELALMSMLPMVVSWVIIVGLMGVLGIEFNIINVILSAFIFGIGDDFSIFIMDGLLARYKDGTKLMNSHKTAILFSAFTVVVGMGALIFAEHPALHSLALISLLGIASVVLVSYTLQPLLFHLFIGRPTAQGLPPYTLAGLVRTGVLFMLFALGCLAIRLGMLVLHVVPIRRERKQDLVLLWLHWGCRLVRRVAYFVRQEDSGRPAAQALSEPCIVVANHTSFIDILQLLALSPRMVMVTNEWVWRSPVFGRIIRYAGFCSTSEGYDSMLPKLRSAVARGCVIAIFPEGTRSYDGQIRRMHKGACYLAQTLELDIVPIILYGNHRVVAKAQPLLVRRGLIVRHIMPTLAHTDTTYGLTYQERTKSLSHLMRQQYQALTDTHSVATNPSYYESLVHNYIYKGPVLEWYIRIKVRMERCYEAFDQLLPRQGRITDIGCGVGPLCYMLAMLSSHRQILGIDYDADKIAIAQHGWLRIDQLSFVHANALQYPLPESDAFVLNDMLHYLPLEAQTQLLERCASHLAPGGMIVVRDGNASDERRHRLTRLTEILSTRIFRFNKVEHPLSFGSLEQMRALAYRLGMTLTTYDNDRLTSNTIYILRLPTPCTSTTLSS